MTRVFNSHAMQTSERKDRLNFYLRIASSMSNAADFTMECRNTFFFGNI